MSSDKTIISSVSVLDAGSLAKFPLQQRIEALTRTLKSENVIPDITLIANGLSQQELSEVSQVLETVTDTQVFTLLNPLDYDEALISGIENAIGEIIITIDLEDPDLNALPEMIDLSKSNDVVTLRLLAAPSTDRYEKMRRKFYGLYKHLVGADFGDVSNQMIISRAVANFLLRHDDASILYRQIALSTGFKQASVTSRSKSRERKRSLHEACTRALRLMTSGTNLPLKALTVVMTCAIPLNALYFLYVLALTIYGRNLEEGWRSTNLALSGGSLVFMIMLVLMSSYLLQIHKSTVRKPKYFIAKEMTSGSISKKAIGSVTN